MRLMSSFSGFASGLTAMALASSALAQNLPVVGRPVDGAMGFQPAGTAQAKDIHDLDYLILVIITIVVVFVTGLLIWVVIRYNTRANPKPAVFTHNSTLEIAWTILPILVLFGIGSFSLPVLFNQVEVPQTDMTVKVTGNQWYWNYDYPGEEVNFDSFLIGEGKVMNADVEAELVKAGYTKEDFLLATDTALVVPVNKSIKVLLTGADVIHAWMVPGLGMQHSAVPGRIGEMWFKAEREGIYFGQCTTLCGKDHAFMPITVKVVSQPVYDKWLADAKAGNVILSANAGTAVPQQVAASN